MLLAIYVFECWSVPSPLFTWHYFVRTLWSIRFSATQLHQTVHRAHTAHCCLMLSCCVHSRSVRKFPLVEHIKNSIENRKRARAFSDCTVPHRATSLDGSSIHGSWQSPLPHRKMPAEEPNGRWQNGSMVCAAIMCCHPIARQVSRSHFGRHRRHPANFSNANRMHSFTVSDFAWILHLI